MPELPEVQALSERLDGLLHGATLVLATPLQFAALKTVQPSPEQLAGSRLHRVARRGKFLCFDFHAARVLVHLSQAGRIDVEEPPKQNRPKIGVVRFSFDERP